MFAFDKVYTLENQRARLSPLLESHLTPLYEVSQDPSIWKYFLEEGMGRENFEQYIANALARQRKKQEYPFVIFDKGRKALAGLTRIYDIDLSLGNVKIGHTWIAKSFQGTGLNKNAKFLLFEFLFDSLDMKRVGFGASAENRRSIQAMKSIGCTQEGVLRSFLPSVEGTGRTDIVLMSMLQEEWRREIREELKKKLEGGDPKGNLKRR